MCPEYAQYMDEPVRKVQCQTFEFPIPEFDDCLVYPPRNKNMVRFRRVNVVQERFT
jgi:hypothetical protein